MVHLLLLKKDFLYNMEEIFYKKKIIAIKLNKMPSTGVLPLTKQSYSLQVLAVSHPKGAVINPHRHIRKERITGTLNECIVVLKGKIKVKLFTPQGKLFKNLILKSGEAFITLAGGHGYEIMEKTQFFEIKNGPFKQDKILLTA